MCVSGDAVSGQREKVGTRQGSYCLLRLWEEVLSQHKKGQSLIGMSTYCNVHVYTCTCIRESVDSISKDGAGTLIA